MANVKLSDTDPAELPQDATHRLATDAQLTKLGALPANADLQTALNAKAANTAVFDSNGNFIESKLPANTFPEFDKTGNQYTLSAATKAGLPVSTAQTAAFQPVDSDLTAIAALMPADNDFLQRKGGVWANRTLVQVKSDLAIPVDRFISSKAYAVGDGVADDTAALNTWLATGNNLYLDSGTYKISGQIASTATRSNVKILGAKDAFIVPTATYPQSGVGAFLKISNVTNLEIDGINITGNGAIASPALNSFDNNMNGINVLTSTNVVIRNCFFTNQPKSAIRIDNCTTVRLDKITATQNYNGATEVFSSSDVQQTGCKFTGRGTTQGANGTTLGSLVGMFFTDCTRVIAANNQIFDFKNTATKADGCTEVIFIGNEIDTFGKDGLKIQASTTNTTIKRGIIANNIVKNKRSYEPDGACYFQIADCEEFEVQGNTATGDGGATGTEYGIYVLSQASGFTCKNGIIANNTITNVASSGIYTIKLSNTTISNNKVTNFATNSSSDYGMWIKTSGDNLDINNNTFANTATPTQGAFGAFLENVFNVKFNDNTFRNILTEGIRVKLVSGEYLTMLNNNFHNVGAMGIYIINLNNSTAVSYGSVKVNNNNFASVNLTTGSKAMELYTGNVAGLTIDVFQFSNNTITKAGTSATALPLVMYNDGFGGVTKFDYAGNGYGGNIGQNPQYGFTPTLITEGSNRFRGTGSPEGVVAAEVGSTYMRTDGGPTTTLYVKTGGTGNTGWTAK